jgi:hypothetical protein
MEQTVLSLMVGTASWLVATVLSAAPGDGALRTGCMGLLLVAFAWPFLLAPASLQLGSPGTTRIVWLMAGLLSPDQGGMTNFSGVGLFLIAARVGPIASWRCSQ